MSQLASRLSVFAAVLVVVGGCGGPPTAPAVTAFTAEKELLTAGQRARLTPVFVGGNASITGIGGAVTSAAVVESEPLSADTTFTLTVTGGDGEATASAEVLVKVVPAPVVTSFTATAPLVLTGTMAELNAVFTGGTAEVSPGVGGVQSGVAKATGALTAAQVFTLTVTNAAGDSAQATTSVEVRPGASITSFTAAKSTVTRGDATTLTARFAAGEALVDQGLGAPTPGTPLTTGPLTQDTTFTLTVTGPVGPPATATVTVSVVDPPVIASFIAAPASLTSGATATLAAQFSGGTANIDQGVGLVTSGSTASVSPSQSTTFTLTVTNAAMDTVTATALVTVVPAPLITAFTAAAADVTVGAQPSLTPVFSGGTASITAVPGPIVSGTATAAPTLSSPGATTYTLTVTNSLGASVSRSVTVTAWPPASITLFTASPASVTTGGAVSLSGAFVGTGSIDQGVGTVTSPFTRSPTVNATTLYTLTVSNPAGDVTTQTTTATAVPPPTITSFTAASVSVNVGAQPSLTAVFGGGTATIFGLAGNVVSGTPRVAAALTSPGPVSYLLTVTNSLGAVVTRLVTVTAFAPASISSFTASPTHITQGTSTVLSGTFVGDGTLSLGGSVTSPFITSRVLGANATVTLTVTNPAGSTTSASVNVTTTPPAVITSFTGRGIPIGDAGVVATVPTGGTVGFTGVFSGGVGRMVWPTATINNVTSGTEYTDFPITHDSTYTLSVTNDAGTATSRTVTVEADHLMYVAGTAGNIGGTGLISVYPSHLKQPGPSLRRIYVQNCPWPTGLAYEAPVGPGAPHLWVACRPSGGQLSRLVRLMNPQTLNTTAAVPATSTLTPITGANTTMTAPHSMVLVGNELVVLNQATATTRASVQVFSSNVGGNVAPLRSIMPPTSGDLTQLGQTSQIFAYQNELYVTSNTFNGVGTQGVLVYPLSWSGTNVAPTRTLTSPLLTNVRGVFVDTTGLYVGATAGTYKFALGSSGAATPLATASSGVNAQLTRFDDLLYSGFRFGLLRQPISLTGAPAVISNTLFDFDTPAATVIDPAY